MVKNVTIFQVKQDKTREYGFINLKQLEKYHGTDGERTPIDMSVYDVVFGETNLEGAVLFYAGRDASDYKFLENLFRLTNVPNEYEAAALHDTFGYKGRSMSVSDIIQINDKFYYCDSLGFDEVIVKNVPHWITVGMGATGSYFSDMTPYEVVDMTASGKTVYIREMNWKRTDKNGQSEMQEYEYTSNPEYPKEAVRKRKDGYWYTSGGKQIAFGFMRQYHDPTF